MNRNNTILNKESDKFKISFFENIIYWLWYYARKIGIMHPWSFARTITSVLKFLNMAGIILIILDMIGINDNDFIGFMLLTMYAIYAIILFIDKIIDKIIYDSRKHCIGKTKYAWNIRDESDCILKEKYDSISKKKNVNIGEHFLFI
jgi:hypothetical protein